ncbi:MAG: lipopolysaccharide heptosyltransferase II [Ignavibacteria bacterium]|nr:lipopolysaccharide heptosyltransferase II [Ignavibacteria bacterium]
MYKLSSYKKILVIRLSSLGDILLTSPLLKSLSAAYENCLIDFLLKPQFAQAVESSPHINEVIYYQKNELRTIRKKIENSSYDYVIDLQNNFRTRRLLRRSSIKVFRFQKPTVKKFLLVNLKVNLLKDKTSIAQRYIDSFPLVKGEKLELEFHYPEGKDEEANLLSTGIFVDRLIIGICPGSKHFTKRYPAEYFSKLINELSQLSYSIFLFGGKEDSKVCSKLAGQNPRVNNFQNENDLYLTAALMKKCSAVISNDSALMHLACSLDIPTLAIFGSTVAEFGFFPLGNKSVLIENINLNCRPCTHIGRNECPKGHFKCMKDISPQMIISKLQSLLKNE